MLADGGAEYGGGGVGGHADDSKKAWSSLLFLSMHTRTLSALFMRPLSHPILDASPFFYVSEFVDRVWFLSVKGIVSEDEYSF